MVVGVQDPKCFQLSLNESSAGAKTRQDPLTIPYFGRTGVLCIPHWYELVIENLNMIQLLDFCFFITSCVMMHLIVPSHYM